MITLIKMINLSIVRIIYISPTSMGKKINTIDDQNDQVVQDHESSQAHKKSLHQFLPYHKYVNVKHKKLKRLLSRSIKTITLDKLQIKKAVECLQEFAIKHKDPTDLIGKDEVIYITVDVSRIPEQHSVRPIQIKLPFPLYSADKKSRYTVIVSDESESSLAETVDSMNVPMLREIISYEKIKKDYKQLKDKKELLAANDMFFCDWKIYNLLRQPLGKLFYEQKKYPYPIDCSGEVPEHLQSEYSSYEEYINGLAGYSYTMLGNGPVYSLKVAKTTMTTRQSVKNIMHGAYWLVAYVLDNGLSPEHIRQICVKTYNSPSLPVYNFLSPDEISQFKAN